jgi:hypothetical protein
MHPPDLPRRLFAAFAFAGLLAGGAPAGAGDFYASADLGISAGEGKASGTTDFFTNTGSDSDSSPVYGGSLGFDVSFAELVPPSAELPIGRWHLRSEFEGLAGRDYELITQGAEPVFSDVTSWTVMQNVWLDFPVHPPVAFFFGRVPILEPMNLYVGAGIGLGVTRIETSDNVAVGSKEKYGFAYQAGIGIGYDLTRRVSVSLGYRYHDPGSIEARLDTPGPVDIGSIKMDLAAHEISAALRVRFFSAFINPPR